MEGEGDDAGAFRMKSVGMKRIRYIYILNAHIRETFKIINNKMHIIMYLKITK